MNLGNRDLSEVGWGKVLGGGWQTTLLKGNGQAKSYEKGPYSGLGVWSVGRVLTYYAGSPGLQPPAVHNKTWGCMHGILPYER